MILMSDDLFNDITVITEDEGNIERQMDKALGIIEQKDSKAGICVIIQQPTGSDDMPGVLFPPLVLDWTILILEHRERNRNTDKDGTGKKAWTVARRIHRILKAHRAGGLTQTFNMRKPCITPYAAARELNNVYVPLVGYSVKFFGQEADSGSYTKVANPTISASSITTTTGTMVGTAGDTVTLACSTSGASIYYTTDLSHPCEQNTAATPYSAPFTVPAGTLRVRAHKPGSVGSDTVAAYFT